MNSKALRILFALSLSSALMAGCKDDEPGPAPSECVPDCSPGYFCLEGTCIEDCNPVCQGGTVCNENRECVDPEGSGDPVDAGTDTSDATEPDAEPDVEPEDIQTPDVPEPDADGSTEPDDAEDGSSDATDGSTEWTEDYPQAACESAEGCAEGQACVGGGCVDPATIDEWPFDGFHGVITGAYVETLDQQPCCFDLDGDGLVDNDLPVLLGALDSTSTTDESTAERLIEQLESGINHLLVAVVPTDVADQAALHIYTAANDLNSDGRLDQTAAQWAEGSGVFQVDSTSFGAYGPQLSWPQGIINENTLRTPFGDHDATLRAARTCPWRWDTLLPLAPDIRCPGERPVSVHWTSSRAEFDHIIEGTTVRSTDSSVDGQTIGGLRIGGYMDLAFVADIMSNSYADNCQCAGIGTEEPLVQSRITSTRLLFECTREITEVELAGCIPAQRTCFGIPDFCEQVALLGAFASHDADGDGIRESIAFGFSATVSPASIDPTSPILPEMESCNDERDNDGDSLTDCDDPECWDSNACDWTFGGEYCNNGIDDDGDDLVDCDDRQCNGNRWCVEE